MLLRFAIENFASFKDAVEFNTFPSSKSHRHDHHKKACGHAVSLQMSAIYGANGAGKSNLVVAMKFLKDLITNGTLSNFHFSEEISFCLDPACLKEPCSIAVEFFVKDKIYYYQIEFNKQKVYSETLLLSKKTVDAEIFKRDSKRISIGDNTLNDGVKRMLRADMPLLSFLGQYYPEINEDVNNVYSWFLNNIEVLMPGTICASIPHLFDVAPEFAKMANGALPEMGTGIVKIGIKKELLSDEIIKSDSDLIIACNAAKQTPDVAIILDGTSDNSACVVFENGKLYKKSLQCFHRGVDGTLVELPFHTESDGTRRVIEYLPLFYAVLYQNKVFMVDEIERSMHPVLIKELVSKLSKSENVKGQLIFTTHESGLLDQDIFRPDEIWLMEKNVEQSTQVYPLSDFNIHSTANIENGYLNGRYGAIPFLSNLKDLHW